MYRLSKTNPNDLTTSVTINVSRNDEQEMSELEMNTRQFQNIPQENQSSNDNIANLESMLKKLKIQKMDIKQINKRKEKELNSQDSPSTHSTHHNTPDEEEICDVCYVNKKIIVLLPCNHLCTCASCASVIIQTSPRCLLCRANIVEVKINDIDGNSIQLV